MGSCLGLERACPKVKPPFVDSKDEFLTKEASWGLLQNDEEMLSATRVSGSHLCLHLYEFISFNTENTKQL